MKMLQKALRYYHTVKYLKPIQIYGQIKFRLHKPKVAQIAPPDLARVLAPWAQPIRKAIKISGNNEITFLNQSRDVSERTIWSDQTIDKLWLYNLHYFDILNSHVSDTLWQKNLIQRWIDDNPPFAGNGWEPYTISLRIVNWIKFELAGNSLAPEIRASLATQVRYLLKRLEIHILGNHFLANIKALIFAGCFFKGAEAELWLKRGVKYLNREIKKQILADGGHIELSPMYQAIVLEDVLDIFNMLTAFQKNIPASWLQKSQHMFNWLQTLSHPDHDVAFFNDTTLGVAPTLAELTAYRERLQLPQADYTHASLTHLADSGYVRATLDDLTLLADVAAVGANHQPGHAHADSLSFEVSLGQQRLLVNSGISTYTTSPQRLKERGTHTHNTVVVNDSDSTDVWQSFRVARRARIRQLQIENTPDYICISAAHDGYAKKYKIIHARRWMLGNNKLIIEDDIRGRRIHKIALHFHLHPAIDVNWLDNKTLQLRNAYGKHLATLQASHAIVVADSTYHPGFNLAVPNKKIIIETVAALPAKFSTTITWSDDENTISN